MAKAKSKPVVDPKDGFDTSGGATVVTAPATGSAELTDKELITKTNAANAEKAKADKEAKAKEKADKAAAKDLEKAAKAKTRAEAKQAREARIAELAAGGKSYTGSMLALADRVKTGAYVKGATGQLRSNDELAQALDGISPTDVVTIALDLLKIEENPYGKLNVGQQSMNLRNRMRGQIKKDLLKVSDIADYVKRNKIHVTTPADLEAKAKEKADKKAKAEADKAEKAAAKVTTKAVAAEEAPDVVTSAE